MVESLLRTKTYIPSLGPNLVPRPQLTDRLESSFQQGYKLILVSAPAGSGKTTLISEWIRQTQHPTGWMSLDEDDNDLSRFFALLITTLKTIQPELSETLFSLARSSADFPSKTILTELINELDTLDTPFVLVLDDYDAIHTDSIHKAINYMVDNGPPFMRTVLVGRVDPPLSLNRWRARSQLKEFRAADLRFSRDETNLFFKKAVQLELTSQDIATLEQRIEGWAAGLQLVSLALQSKLISKTSLSSDESSDPHHYLATLARANRYTIDYLIEEVFNRQPRNVQSFLLQTSILDRLSASLCASVAREPWDLEHLESRYEHSIFNNLPGPMTADESQAMLEYLERSNLFLIPLDAEGRWYRYHPLFASAVADYLHQLPQERILLLNQRASAWFEQNGFLPDAIQHALAGQDFEGAARMVEHVADSMLWSRGESSLLLRWLGAIPAEVTRTRPRLLILQAWVELWSYHFERIEPLIQAALQVLPDDQPLQAAIMGEAAAIQTELARLQGDIPLALEKAEQARQLLSQLARKTGPGSVILGIIASAYRANGDTREAYRNYAEASHLMEGEGKIPPALIATGYQIQLLVLQGKLHQGFQLYQRTQKWAEERHASTAPAFGLVLIQAGDILREQNDLDEAERLLHEGIRISLQMEGLADDTFDGFISLARLHQASGDFARAEIALEQAEQLGQKYHVANAETQIAVWRTRFAMRRGETVTAERWMVERGLSFEGQFSYIRENEYIILARSLLEQNQTTQAGQILSHLLSAVDAGGRSGRSIELLGVQALAYHQSGMLTQALTTLTQAFEMGKPEGYVRTFVDEGPRMENLIRLVVSRGISVDYSSGLLRAFKAPTARQVQNLAGVQPLIDPLTGRELEVLRLMSAGLTNREIADEFFVSLGTIKSHINRIYHKLEVNHRVRAIARAKELNLL